ncbi:protein kinase domain-containing protein [Hyalangium rubrum]|uniref:non-specific serine/threonine protein kinase n=1 Tax=Hyalangium rubrum TaxID=3103134 RepID=A0ABU5HCS0_9BACT|nr:discoidin domain-containing protein [Hyalangium sp. s54d21]MDY7231263.1 discoidin domain-containing protein [Hyalangium sp. s54d21]
MSARPGSTSREGPPPPPGLCPYCGQQPSGERCVHCGTPVRVGPYQVRQLLGQRGPARTYLAEDTDGLVVLKELSFSSEPDAATLAAFHQEARQLQALTHPRIPRYLDMLQFGLGLDMRLYLSQEFMEGTSLEAVLSSRRPTESEARELARQVLDILQYLQGRTPPVFHGDLKPANLIRRPDEALFLVDFGAAWVPDGAGEQPSRYMPPDQPVGALDATTDLYSLGVTLVDALNGEPSGKQRSARLEPLAATVNVSPAFRAFLGRLTAADKRQRFTSAAEALRELEQPERAPVARSRRSRIWPVMAGTSAALVLFGAGVLTGRSTQPPPRVVNQDCSTVSQIHPSPLPPKSRGSKRQVMHAPGLTSVLAHEAGRASREISEARVPNHQPRLCEFAKEGTASATGHWGTGTPGSAFDHDAGTVWRSNASTGAWLEVDLGSPRLLDTVVVDWAWDTNYGPSAESLLQTSLDGTHWTYLHRVRNEPQDNNVARRVSFPQRSARYVRFQGTQWNGGWAHVRSLEVYGPACPSETTNLRKVRADESDMTNSPGNATNIE